jgi:chromosome segregation ATPase
MFQSRVPHSNLVLQVNCFLKLDIDVSGNLLKVTDPSLEISYLKQLRSTLESENGTQKDLINYLKDDKVQLKDQVVILTNKNGALENQVDNLKIERNELTNKVDSLKNEIENLNNKIEKLKHEKVVYKVVNDWYEEENKLLEKTLDEKKDIINFLRNDEQELTSVIARKDTTIDGLRDGLEAMERDIGELTQSTQRLSGALIEVNRVKGQLLIRNRLLRERVIIFYNIRVLGCVEH